MDVLSGPTYVVYRVTRQQGKPVTRLLRQVVDFVLGYGCHGGSHLLPVGEEFVQGRGFYASTGYGVSACGGGCGVGRG